ncbi:MAG: T9SS type A sorting domain-containing protein [Ignavibacteriales bacterium]|nr:T9SS type A sorting domain-containing protein [Ignavibacteriales bacterium]
MKSFSLRYSLFTIIFLLISNNLFAQASFNTGEFAVTLNEYGRIRLYAPDTTAIENRQLERMSLLVSGKLFQVFDYQNDADTEEPTINVENPQNSDHEIYGSYNNYYSAEPPEILQKMNVYGWDGGKYILVKNTIINRDNGGLNSIIGMDIIPYLDYAYGFDTVSYDASNNLIRSHRGGTNLGYKLLSHNLKSMHAFEWYDGYTLDNDYWSWLNYSQIDQQYVSTTVDGPVIIIAQNSASIDKGDSLIVYYAVALGANEQEMLESMQDAEEKYNLLTDIKDKTALVPDKVILNQNYPNPFNPTTVINFGLPEKSNVEIKVYNLLGQQVANILNKSLPEGMHSVEFNASNLPSGIYIYSLKSENNLLTKKMTLLK